MASLYITEQGATLRKEQNRLIVEHNGHVLASLHDFKLDRVVIFGNVQITSQAMALLMDKGIDTTFVSLTGHLKGRLAPIASKNVTLRRTQYERSQDRAFALNVARAIVAGKISNSLKVLARYQRHRPDVGFAPESAELARLSTGAAQSQSVDSLRGLEGHAAVIYFQCFARLLRKGFEFNRRTRRPPKDPINAMLSFGYSLLYNEAISAVTACGFDPYIGFYHSFSYGRCSLALDLMEEMRTLVADRLTIYLANTEALSPNQFRNDAGGVRLDPEGRKRFLRGYEEMINKEFTDRITGRQTTLRLALYEQAQSLIISIRDRGTYRPFQGWR